MTEMPNENKDLQEEKVEEEQEIENPKKSIRKKIDKLNEEIEKLKADANHWKNEYYRAYADTKNLRASLEKEHLEAMRYRAEGFVEDLLPVLDSFYLALANEPTDPALKNYLVGFQYIYKNLSAVLENEGVAEIPVKVGDKFNPATMNAMEAVEDEGEEGIVKTVFSKGYKLHDRMIRPVNVAVSVHKKKENNDSEPESDA
ncbi:MAG: nucleotide exchange factor GrpE [Bacilli bacterium]|nr:nucleotide exchange factor GrpE [Bacilli bacterium]